MTRPLRYISYLLIVSGLIIFLASDASAQTASVGAVSDRKTQLEQEIQAKSRDLDAINRQIEDTRKSLDQTRGQKSSLQKELNTIQGNIKSLNLSIKSDQVSIEKLGLEINTLEEDMADIEASIVDKRAAMKTVLLSLQKDGQDNMMLAFLQNKTLSDGIMDANNLARLHSRLLSDIEDLRTLNERYKEKVNFAQNKHEKIITHTQTLKDKITIVEDQKQQRQALLDETKNKESAYQKQMSELQKRQQQIDAEIADIDAKLRAEINSKTLPAARKGVLGFPVEGGLAYLTQSYGNTPFAQKTYSSKRHNGIDFGMPIGTAIYAAESGIVAASGNQDAYCHRGAYGKFVAINHDNNLTTLYAHLSRYLVSAGDHVARGQLIGYVGNTGFSSGPHLHFTVYARDTFRISGSRSCGPMPQGGDLNPLQYL